MKPSSNTVLDFLNFIEGQGPQPMPRLMDKILLKCRLLTNAEAGSIFIVRGRGPTRRLQAMRVQNDRVRIRAKGFEIPLDAPAIAAYVGATGKTLRIPDVYRIPKNRPYRFNPANERAGYVTRSVMCFPLKNFRNSVTGVVQLINRLPDKAAPGAEPIPFDSAQEELVLPVSRILADLVERADMSDRIRAKNRELQVRNRQLREGRARIAALQAETEEAFMLSISLLARAAEIHDEETGNHIVRVNEYSYHLARMVGQPAEWCDEIRYSAQLHDVGKMSVDAAILRKKGPLTPEERHEMNSHPVYGHQILAAAPRLAMAAEIAQGHHEKWAGGGYPNGWQGEQIPLSARIVAMADIYDALRSARPYKPAFSHEKTVAIMTEGDDRLDPREHFDPALLDLFRNHHQEFDEIYRRLHD